MFLRGVKHKIFSALLVSVLLLSSAAALFSCENGNPQGSGSGTPIQEEGWYSDLNYRGEELKIDQSVNVWSATDSIANAAKYTQGPDEKGEDEVANLCYDRNLTVAATLNLAPIYRPTDLRYNLIMSYYDNLFSTGTVPDLIINDVYPVLSMTLNGQLVNVKNKNEAKYGVNYFDFDAVVSTGGSTQKCWYNDFMEGLTIDESKVYAVAGDYFFDVIRSAHCLYLNTDLFMTKIAPATEWKSLEDFYDYIERRAFTYDDFAIMCNLAWEDSGTDQGITDAKDIVGFCYTGLLYPFIYGTDLRVLTMNNGALTVNGSSLALSDFTCQLINFLATDGVLTTAPENPRQKFTSNQALFASGYWMGDLEYSSFKNMEKKSAVVYPMAKKSYGEYRTYVHDSAEIGYIPVDPVNPSRFSKVSAFLQLSTELSSPIIDVYFNEALKYRDNTDASAIRMLDVIHDTIGSSFNQFVLRQVAVGGNAKLAPHQIIGEGVSAMQDKTAQLYAENLYAYEKGLAALQDTFNKLS